MPFHQGNYRAQQGGMQTQGMMQGMNQQQGMMPAMNQQQGMMPGMNQQQGMGQQQGLAQQHGMGTAQWGAHEAMEVHEVLTDHIDGINQFELYRPHIKDQQLMSILDKQLQHMVSGYQNLVNYVHNQGMHAAEPYRAPRTNRVKYGLQQPAPNQPNTNPNEMDDRDVASGMMGCAKASALVCTAAALECADPNLRQMITNCAVSSINQAYEVFQYMNQKGMYQVPTMQQKTTQTMANSYQNPGNMQFQ